MSDPTQYNILWGRLEDERRSHRAYQQKLKARIAELEAEVTYWKLEARDSENAFNRANRYAKQLQAQLRAADELADAVSAWETGSPAKLSTYFRAMSDALIAYREASNGTKA